MTASQFASDQLAALVGDAHVFVNEVWDGEPWWRSVSGEAFAHLLAATDVEDLLETSLLRAGQVRVVTEGRPRPPSDYTHVRRVGAETIRDLVDPVAVFNWMAKGATVVLLDAEQYCRPIARACRGVQAVLGPPTQASVYITPGRQQGFKLHYDTEDVLVMQIAGSKAWRVYGRLADGRPEGHVIREDGIGPPVLEVELQPGDCLYLPRFTPHGARSSTDRSSVHVTLGITPTSWADLFGALVATAGRKGLVHRAALSPALYDSDEVIGPATVRLKLAEALRSDLPHALSDDDFARALEAVRPASPAPLLDGWLGALDSLRHPAKTYARRPLATASVAAGDGGMVLTVNDKRFQLPDIAAPLLDELLGTDTFPWKGADESAQDARAQLIALLVTQRYAVPLT
jgi:hypothetical protein